MILPRADFDIFTRLRIRFIASQPAAKISFSRQYFKNVPPIFIARRPFTGISRRANFDDFDMIDIMRYGHYEIRIPVKAERGKHNRECYQVTADDVKTRRLSSKRCKMR